MFGHNQPFDLQRMPWGRKMSMFIVYEDFYNHDLYLSHVRTGILQSERKNLFRMQPVTGGEILEYTYFADEKHLRMDTGKGSVELCLDELDQVRIRGRGVGLRLTCPMPGDKCEGLFDKRDGSIEISFGIAGKSLWLPLQGEMDRKISYDNEGSVSEIVIEFDPDDGGAFEAAAHEYILNRKRDAYYRPFDEIMQDSAESFKNFKNCYMPPVPGYEDTTNYAQYVVWTHMQGRDGQNGAFKQPLVYMHRQWFAMAFSWQQSFNAMAMLNDTGEAWRLLTSLIDYQLDSGMFPGQISTFDVKTSVPQAAMQGFAFSHILENAGDGFLTPERCEKAYEPFCKWTRFWIEYHGTGEPDHLQYLNLYESGWDDGTVFIKGIPCQAPDVYALVSLQCEMCGKMAGVLGKTEEARAWNDRAKRFVDVLVKDYWDGETFVPVVTPTKEKVANRSLVSYLPIILGKRLPEHIVDKIARTLIAEGEYLTDIGLAAESLKSPHVSFSRVFYVMGKVLAPANMFITVGLKRAGKDKEAREIARRWCDKIKKSGFLLGFAPLPTEVNGEPYIDPNVPNAGDTWSWTSWSAACFLTVSHYVLNT